MIDSKQLAAKLGCSVAYLNRLASAGRISPAPGKFGRSNVFDPDSIITSVRRGRPPKGDSK